MAPIHDEPPIHTALVNAKRSTDDVLPRHAFLVVHDAQHVQHVHDAQLVHDVTPLFFQANDVTPLFFQAYDVTPLFYALPDDELLVTVTHDGFLFV
ncbi:MAG: hypothetical protein QF535_10490 [Anaerolineales bacterium]|nr:hypothetical protein [Anaerolineales bacterium]